MFGSSSNFLKKQGDGNSWFPKLKEEWGINIKETRKFFYSTISSVYIELPGPECRDGEPLPTDSPYLDFVHSSELPVLFVQSCEEVLDANEKEKQVIETKTIWLELIEWSKQIHFYLDDFTFLIIKDYCLDELSQMWENYPRLREALQLDKMVIKVKEHKNAIRFDSDDITLRNQEKKKFVLFTLFWIFISLFNQVWTLMKENLFKYIAED